MKNIIFLSMVFLTFFLFGACKDKSTASKPDTKTAETQVAQQSAPPSTSAKTEGGVNLKTQAVTVQRAVLDFRKANGRFPESLDELKSSAQIDFDISKYNYDPVTGRVTLKQ